VLDVSCHGFKNPRYQTEYSGFKLRTYDQYAGLIEISESISLDTRRFKPLILPASSLTITPQSLKVATSSQWAFELHVPMPMEEGCIVKLTYPGVIGFDREVMRGEGMFSRLPG